MMSNQSKRTSSKVVTKETKGIKTKSSKAQSVRSKGTATVMKCTVVAGQRGKAGSRSKKAIVKTAIAAKKGIVHTYACVTFVHSVVMCMYM